NDVDRVGRRQLLEGLVVRVLHRLDRRIDAFVGRPAWAPARAAAVAREQDLVHRHHLLGREEAQPARHRRGGRHSPRSYAASSSKARPCRRSTAPRARRKALSSSTSSAGSTTTWRPTSVSRTSLPSFTFIASAKSLGIRTPRLPPIRRTRRRRVTLLFYARITGGQAVRRPLPRAVRLATRLATGA